jgi:hypothetical protein
LSSVTRKRLVTVAEAVPEDHTVLTHFRAWHLGVLVTVTAVLERTCVILPADQTEKKLVNKHLLFVEEGFTLAVVDAEKKARHERAARGWRTNWRRQGKAI